MARQVEQTEHTFFAYDEAVRADADFLECDLQLSKDGVLVCVHDATVDRTSESSGRVDAFTLAELRQQDFGTWFSVLVSLYRVEAVGRQVLTGQTRTGSDGRWRLARTFSGTGRFGFVSRTGARTSATPRAAVRCVPSRSAEPVPRT